MSDLREAAQQALEALSLALIDGDWRARRGRNSPTQPVIHRAYEALRAALEQENGRPCSCRWVNDTMTQECTLHRIIKEQAHDWCERAKAAEAKLGEWRELTQQLVACHEEDTCPAVKQAKEMLEQEPVAWVNADHLQGLTLGHYGHAEIYTGESQGRIPLYTHPPRREQEQEPVAIKDDDGLTLKAGWDDLPVGTPLYTTPPRREWQGLTLLERSQIMADVTANGNVGIDLLICAFEDALRRKNT
jgi:hypothetical protein